MESKKFWIGVDEYGYDMDDDHVPTVFFSIGDLRIKLRDVPGKDDELQLLDLEEHDQDLKNRFIKATRRIQMLPVNVRKELFGVPNVWDAMEKHTIDFIEGALDDYEAPIKVGDEIFDNCFRCRGIIIGIDDDTYCYLQQGSGDRIGLVKKRATILKTGKHFDFIEQYCKKEGNE